MPFNKVESWTITARMPPARAGYWQIPSILEQIVRLLGGTRMRRMGSLLATLAVHVALLLFILFRLTDVPGAVGNSASEVMTLIDIGHDNQPAPQAEPSQPQSAAIEEQPSDTDLDASTMALPVEWSVVKMKVAKPVAAVGVAPPAPMPSAPSPSSAAGNPPSGGYDPYAGAAPQWRQPPSSYAAAPPLLQLNVVTQDSLDPGLLRRIRMILKRAGLQAGSVRMVLTVDRDRRATDVRFEGVSVAADAMREVQHVLRGRSSVLPASREPPAASAGSQGETRTFVMDVSLI